MERTAYAAESAGNSTQEGAQKWYNRLISRREFPKIAAGGLLAAKHTLDSVIAHAQSPRHVQAQFADGDGYRFNYIVTNPGNEGENRTIYFRDDNGNPVILTIDGMPQSSLTFYLPPGGSRLIGSSGVGSLKSGYIDSQTSNPNSQATSSLILDYFGRESSVPSSRISTMYKSPAERIVDSHGNAFINFGVAIANITERSADYKFSLLQNDGSVLGNASLTLAPGQHYANFIDRIFRNAQFPQNFEGSLKVTSNEPFARVAYRINTLNGNHATFNDLDASAIVQRIIYPQIADGGGFNFEIILLNNGDKQENIVTVLKLRDLSGNLAPVTTIDGIVQSSFNTLLPPNGTRRIKTNGSDPLKAGYGSSTPQSLDARISGSGILNFYGNEISIPEAPLTTESHSYIEQSSLIKSGVAISNDKKNIALTLFLLDENGVKHAQKQISLAAEEHMAKYAHELFPDYFSANPNFRGTMHATSDGGEFAMIALRENRQKPVFTYSALNCSPRAYDPDRRRYTVNFVETVDYSPLKGKTDFFVADKSGNLIYTGSTTSGRATFFAKSGDYFIELRNSSVFEEWRWYRTNNIHGKNSAQKDVKAMQSVTLDNTVNELFVGAIPNDWVNTKAERIDDIIRKEYMIRQLDHPALAGLGMRKWVNPNIKVVPVNVLPGQDISRTLAVLKDRVSYLNSEASRYLNPNAFRLSVEERAPVDTDTVVRIDNITRWFNNTINDINDRTKILGAEVDIRNIDDSLLLNTIDYIAEEIWEPTAEIGNPRDTVGSRMYIFKADAKTFSRYGGVLNAIINNFDRGTHFLTGEIIMYR